MNDADILVVDTVTKLGPEAVGRVVIAASHGGVYAGYEAAHAGVRGVILHDAGVGLDQAGIGCLAYLGGLGIAGATIDYRSATIGNGESMANDGVISFVNDTAARAGCDCRRTLSAPMHSPGTSNRASRANPTRVTMLGVAVACGSRVMRT